MTWRHLSNLPAAVFSFRYVIKGPSKSPLKSYFSFCACDFRGDQIRWKISANAALTCRPANLQNMQIWRCRKKPKKTWRLGPQRWRFPKYVLNENKNGRFLVSRYSLPYLCTYCILFPRILKSQFLFRCRREAPG